jgi:hypothetical protein
MEAEPGPVQQPGDHRGGGEGGPGQHVLPAEHRAEARDVLDQRQADRGQRAAVQPAGAALVAEERVHGVRSRARRKEVEADARDDGVRAEVQVQHAEQQREQRAGRDPADGSGPHRAAVPGDQRARAGGAQHRALQGDVGHPGPLGQQPAEGGEDVRRGHPRIAARNAVLSTTSRTEPISGPPFGRECVTRQVPLDEFGQRPGGHEQHDDRLDDGHGVGADVGLLLHHVTADPQIRVEERGGDHTDRVVAAQQGDDDALEGQAAGHVGLESAVDPEREVRSGEAGQRAADDEAPLDGARHVEAAVAGEVRVGAGDADAVAERGPGEQEPDGRGHREHAEQADVRLVQGDAEELREEGSAESGRTGADCTALLPGALRWSVRR